MSTLSLQLSADEAEMQRLQKLLDDFPAAAARARARALRMLGPWVEHEVLRAAVAASGIDPFIWRALARFFSRGRDDSLSVWLGTSDIAAHHLGDVRWSPQMPGTLAGGRIFPRAWSWAPPRETAGLIMQRKGTARLPIEVTFFAIHAAVLRDIEGQMPRINARYQSLMVRELERAMQEAAA